MTLQLLLYYLEHYGAQYIGVSSKLPEATEIAIISSFERVLLISAPFQDFLTKMRQISQWDNPRMTSMYMVAYFYLWVNNYLVVSAVSVCFFSPPNLPASSVLTLTVAQLLILLCKTVCRRYFPPTIGALRASLERAEDAGTLALNLSEHIDQYGAHRWVEPLIKRTGPTILSHLENLASVLEMIRKYALYLICFRLL